MLSRGSCRSMASTTTPEVAVCACAASRAQVVISGDRMSSDEVPGPGHNNANISAVRPLTTSVTIGGATRPPLSTCDPCVPAPNAYMVAAGVTAHPSSQLRSSAAFSIACKAVPAGVLQVTPGPGTYRCATACVDLGEIQCCCTHTWRLSGTQRLNRQRHQLSVPAGRCTQRRDLVQLLRGLAV